MRLHSLRQFALGLPQTKVVNQWGGLVFKVAEKMFLLLVLDGETIDGVIFKCTPEEFDELTEIDGIIQAPYCAKRLWACVKDLGALPPDELERRIQRSYDLVVAKLPKKTQLALRENSAAPQPPSPATRRRAPQVRHGSAGRATPASAGRAPKRRAP